MSSVEFICPPFLIKYSRPQICCYTKSRSIFSELLLVGIEVNRLDSQSHNRQLSSVPKAPLATECWSFKWNRVSQVMMVESGVDPHWRLCSLKYGTESHSLFHPLLWSLPPSHLGEKTSSWPDPLVSTISPTFGFCCFFAWCLSFNQNRDHKLLCSWFNFTQDKHTVLSTVY